MRRRELKGEKEQRRGVGRRGGEEEGRRGLGEEGGK